MAAQQSREIGASCRKWNHNNPEKINAHSRQWKRKNPANGIAAGNRRRARKRATAINDFTAAQWLEMQAAYDHRCVYCGTRRKGNLTQDHIIPLSKGGNHTRSNIVPACRSCNSKKGTGKPLAPVQLLLL